MTKKGGTKSTALRRHTFMQETLRHMKPWHAITVFLLAAGALGTGVVASIGKFERTYGAFAQWAGLAQKKYVDRRFQNHTNEIKEAQRQVTGAVNDIQAEQLFDKIGRLERLIVDMEKKKDKTWMDDQQLRQTREELRRVKNKYESLEKRH